MSGKEQYKFKITLFGPGGVGKTSIIQAIAAIFNITFGGSIENDFPSKLINPPFTTRIEIDVLFISSNNSLRACSAPFMAFTVSSS